MPDHVAIRLANFYQTFDLACVMSWMFYEQVDNSNFHWSGGVTGRLVNWICKAEKFQPASITGVLASEVHKRATAQHSKNPETEKSRIRCMNLTRTREKASERNLSSLKDTPSFLFYFCSETRHKKISVDGIDKEIRVWVCWILIPLFQFFSSHRTACKFFPSYKRI